MKRCPKCNLKYDDTLSFCLEDGAGLLHANDPDETLVLPHSQPQATLPAMHFQTPTIPRELARPHPPNRLLYALILFLAIFAVGVTVALFYKRDKPTSNAQTQSSPNPTQGQITANQALASPTLPPTQNGNLSPYDLSGGWILLDTLESTSYSSYANSQVSFRMSVTQVGNEFTAQGQKYLLNGRELPSSQRTAIRINGSIEGDTIHATFVENGTRRDSTGTFTWKIEKGGKTLRGRFASNAARSSGTSIATKQ